MSVSNSEVSRVLSESELRSVVGGKGGGGGRRSSGNVWNSIERYQRFSRNSTENALRESQYRRSLGLRYGS